MSTPSTEKAALPRTYDELRAEIAALLETEPDSLREDDSLLDWGLDSIRALSLLERLREAGIEIPFIDFAQEPTLRHLATRMGVGEQP